MRLVLGILLACVLSTTASAKSTLASAWDLDDMNKAIDQTNFVVDRGCSGTLISLKLKLILTNYHCIENSVTSFETEVTNKDGHVRKVRVRRYKDVPLQQNNYEGFTPVGSASYIGEIIAEEQTKDLAVIKVKGTLPHTYASPLLPDGMEVARGERVYVVGNPAMNYGSLVEGIISSVNRTFEFPWTKNEKLPMIQFSGGIFGGNSGGALYNDKGQLIGVPAAGFMMANFIGLAVPVSIVKTFLKNHCLASVYDDNAKDAECVAAKLKKAEAESNRSND